MEPERKQKYDIQPDTRPDLRIIEGGEEKTPGRAQLKAVPNNTDQKLSGLEQSAADASQFPSNVTPIDVHRGETEPKPVGEEPEPINSKFTGAKNKQKIPVRSRLKKSAPLIGVGVGLAALAAVFFALLPLKLNMFAENITKYASEVPGFAVQRRTEYVANRLFATYLIRKAGNLTGTDADAKAKMVFCKDASISCSLLSTYGADYFDKLIDVNIGATSGDTVKMTITPKGRTALGGNARTWTVDIERTLEGGELEKTTQTLINNSTARAYIKDLVNTNLKTKTVATRFLARTILMKKYGITHWRAFEKISNKIDETKTRIKASVLKNTVGKVSDKMALYLGCFSNPDVCDSMKDGLSTKASDLQEKIDKLDDGDPQKARLQAQKVALDKLAGNTPLTDEDLAAGAAKSIIVRRLLLAAGAVGVIGTIDLVFKAVEAVNNGALEQVTADMAKTAYIGFAFGDDTGLVPNIDKIKAGDGDLAVYGELSSLLDGAEQSPLMQYENGIITADDVNSKSFVRTCNVDDEQKPVTLDKGQLVCPERTIARDYTSLLTTNPSWIALAQTASLWNNSIGAVIGAVSGFTSNLPIISQIGDFVSQVSKPALEWAMSLFLTPPTTGYETTGQNNYDALSGAIRDTQNEMMEEGVSADGKAYGAGGAVLSSGDVAAISNSVNADEQTDFNNQPLVARIFNPSLSGSFAQQLLARIPTSLSGLAALPSTSLASITSLVSPTSSATSATTVNPFGLPIYGYAADDPALTADPSIYTEDKCAETAKLRADSYGRDLTRSTLPTYAVSDPCALEKMVVGSMLQAQGVTDDPYSLQEPGTDTSTPSAAAVTGRPDGAVNAKNGWTFTPGVDYSKYECDPRTSEYSASHVITPTRTNSPATGATVRLCKLPTPYWYGGSASNGGDSVASVISTNAMNMLQAARDEAGINLDLRDGFRINFNGGYVSQHTTGLSMDLGVTGANTICRAGADSVKGWGSAAAAETQCKRIGGVQYQAYKWLQQNAARFGFYNLEVEPWHWSTSGL